MPTRRPWPAPTRDLAYSATDVAALDGLDLVFCALPHGRSQALVPELADRVGVIVDLAADFRLRDPGLYPIWYGEAHRAPELLSSAAYGLPELYRDGHRRRPAHRRPRLLPDGGHPGHWPRCSTPGSSPRRVPSAPPLVVDAASGVSGAGRAAKDTLHFGAVDEDFVAYGLLDHRHTAEMEQALGVPVLFTPHLAPMARGILVTAYGRATSGLERVGGPSHVRRCPGRPAGPLPGRALRGGHRRAPVDQGNPGVERRAPLGPGRPAHGVAGGARPRSTT